ncbi:MAG: MerR family transcriptional regulator, light-induced transcriptional regulator [Solirubrobacteraceae bacterium]|jgi:DICT domain-containing protein/predicted DNA-binding transcriptional regulator AlpA|nr:MerR family transcriptional regulator, light-induced transcriptional regulator [Solirubrobacteraceae bacterium]
MERLAIRELAERTGLAAGTIRMWEQRHGFPRPERTKSGYRRYTDEDVATLRRALAFRERGFSVPAALERAQSAAGATDRPSIYAAVAAYEGRPRLLRKPTLLALSRAIEDETLSHAAAPVCFASFQQESFYRPVESRYRRIAQNADATTVFADFPAARFGDGAPAELPIGSHDALGNEWAVIVDAPGYAACLLAWEQPDNPTRGGPDDDRRRFEALWTLEPRVVRDAAMTAARLAGGIDAAYGRELAERLTDRPLAIESPAPALTSLTNRAIAYLEAD